MLDNLELRIARSKIERFQHEANASVVSESTAALDCMACEEFLSNGIAALEWLERSEQCFHEADSEGIFEVTTQLSEAIETLYSAWLIPCPRAEQWIVRCRANGYEITNLDQFRDCKSRVQDWLDRNVLYKKSKEAREERFAEEAW